MKKVLLIGPLGDSGGVAKYTKDLLEADLEYKVELFNISRIKKNAKYKTIGYGAFRQIGVIRLISSLFITLFHMFRYPFVLLFKNPKIVHIGGTSFFMFWEKSYYLLMAKLFGKKVLLHYLGSLDQYYNAAKNFEKRYIRFILKKTDKLALLSERVKKLVSDFMPDDKLIVIPSSVDVEKFDASQSKMPFHDPKYTDILFLGGADPKRKGLDVILKAVPIIFEKMPDIRFIMSGGEIIKTSIDTIHEQHEAYKPHLVYLGWIKEEDKFSVFNSVDLFVLPSFNEGLPYAIIEALAAKLPIVATPVGGIPEVVKDGENGFIVDFDDFEALAKAILNLHANKELLNTISQNNYEKALNQYSLKSAFGQIQSIYKSFS